MRLFLIGTAEEESARHSALHPAVAENAINLRLGTLRFEHDGHQASLQTRVRIRAPRASRRVAGSAVEQYRDEVIAVERVRARTEALARSTAASPATAHLWALSNHPDWATNEKTLDTLIEQLTVTNIDDPALEQGRIITIFEAFIRHVDTERHRTAFLGILLKLLETFGPADLRSQFIAAVQHRDETAGTTEE